MIVKEFYEGNLYRFYSDKGVYIHGGFPESDYEEAIDVEDRVFVETDKPIIIEDSMNVFEKAGRILMGVDE